MPPSSECAEIVAVTSQTAACFLNGLLEEKTVFKSVEVAVSFVRITAGEFGSSALDVVVQFRFRDVELNFYFMVISEVIVDICSSYSSLSDGVDYC